MVSYWFHYGLFHYGLFNCFLIAGYYISYILFSLCRVMFWSWLESSVIIKHYTVSYERGEVYVVIIIILYGYKGVSYCVDCFVALRVMGVWVN